MKNSQSFIISPTFCQTRNHDIPRNNTPFPHLLEQIQTHLNLSSFTKPTNHQIPHNHISVAHFIKQFLSILHHPTSGVKLYHPNSYGAKTLKPTSNNLFMDTSSNFDITKSRTRLEQWRKSVLVRPNSSIFHRGQKTKRLFKGST
uniref:Uncharacterized protein n=1 Tax=Rhizophora mucronata TaxID=61149 RepID=A0A2P2P042_RHIMU